MYIVWAFQCSMDTDHYVAPHSKPYDDLQEAIYMARTLKETYFPDCYITVRDADDFYRTNHFEIGD